MKSCFQTLSRLTIVFYHSDNAENLRFLEQCTALTELHLSIYEYDMDIADFLNRFKRLKKLGLNMHTIYVGKSSTEEISHYLETLRIYALGIESDLYPYTTKRCPNLSKLSVTHNFQVESSQHVIDLSSMDL